MKKMSAIISMLGIIMIASGCVTYDSLYKYADKGRFSYPQMGLNFSYPADWKVAKLDSPYMMYISRGEEEIYISGASRQSENLGYIDNMDELYELLSNIEREYSVTYNIESKTISGKEWILIESSYPDSRRVSYELITLCPSFVFNIDFSTNSTEGKFDILYPIAESLEC